MWLHFKSRTGNRLSIEIQRGTHGYRLFKDDWLGLKHFWQLDEISFSSSDIPCWSYMWFMLDKMNKIIPPVWYNDYLVDLSLKVSNGDALIGRILVQNLQDYYEMSTTQFQYSLSKDRYRIIYTTLSDPKQFHKIWKKFNIGGVSHYLFGLEYLYGRVFSYYSPTSLFVQAKTYTGDTFLSYQMDFSEMEVERNEKTLRQVFESTVRVRCWQSEFHFKKNLPPKFAKNFRILRHFPSRCFVYANYNDSYDTTEANSRYFIYLGVEKYEPNVNEIIENWDIAVPPQLHPLFECLLRIPSDRRKINILRGLRRL